MYVVQVEAPTSPYVVFPKFQNGFKGIFRTNPTFTVVSKGDVVSSPRQIG